VTSHFVTVAGERNVAVVF